MAATAGWLSHAHYLASLLAMCPFVAVLGARRPGAGVWHAVVLALLVVLSLPLFQASIGRFAPRPVILDEMWSLFVLCVVSVGVLNYLPTRYAPAAVLYAVAQASQLLPLSVWFSDAADASQGTVGIAPVALSALVLGTEHVFVDIGIFFSKLAVVSFGGAYALLAYMAQQAVENYGWMSAPEMVDGLGLAETRLRAAARHGLPLDQPARAAADGRIRVGLAEEAQGVQGLAGGEGRRGLAGAATIAATLEFALLFALLHPRIGFDARPLRRTIGSTAIGTIVMAQVIVLVLVLIGATELESESFRGALVRLVGAGGLGALAFIAVTYLLNRADYALVTRGRGR